jgi:hypothetical protein
MRISECQKGRIPWNKGLTKETSFIIMKGIKLLSESHKGQVAWNKGLTKETDNRVRKYSESNMGHICTDETRQKLSKSHLGQIAWNKGMKNGIR